MKEYKITPDVIKEMLEHYKLLLDNLVGHISNYNATDAENIYMDIAKHMWMNDKKIYPFIGSKYKGSNLSYILYVLYVEIGTKYYRLKLDLEISEYYMKHKDEIVSNWLELVSKLSLSKDTKINLEARDIDEILQSQYNISNSSLMIIKEMEEIERKMNLYHLLYRYFKSLEEPYSIVKIVDEELLCKECGFIKNGSCEKKGTDTCVEGCLKGEYIIVAFPSKNKDIDRSKIISRL